MKLSLSLSVLGAALLLASSTVAAPLEQRAALPVPPTGADPAITTRQSVLDAAIQCPWEPNQSFANVKKPLLLIPGTGNTGAQTYEHNWKFIGKALGFDPCWVTGPNQMLADSQIAAEYVFNAVDRLYAASGNKKVPVMAWSQGNLVTQWVLTFFPSSRAKVDRFVAMSPDFRGTLTSYTRALSPAGPSIKQQATESRFLNALHNAGGLNSYVPTTTIWSFYDEVVQPQSGPDASARLNGASNFMIQDVCGPIWFLEHSQVLFQDATTTIAKRALTDASGKAPQGAFKADICSQLIPKEIPIPDRWLVGSTITIAATALAFGPGQQVCEPSLKDYSKPYDTTKSTNQCEVPITEALEGKLKAAGLQNKKSISDIIWSNNYDFKKNI
ncbi:hypothetical protein CBOM_02596 [Ceraceosorus bombacis]|uniref:Uncharacterized protein n=1 Tax=Ceraceosorus bombacis TaxID=401625 RepID=A0A0P1BGX1_9BASI|nr:hypothetical protein CBOM_02596 [Ceraceosorus bombacis]